MGVACTEERPVMHWVREIIKFRRLFYVFMNSLELMNNQQNFYFLYCVEAINKK